jgi:BRCA1-associated protein
LEREIEKARKRNEKADELGKKLGKDWREEKTINESLMERVKFLDTKIKEGEIKREQLETEKKELEEQNRDLTFFISGGDKLKEMGEEVIGGKVEVPVAEQGGGGKKKKGKKR